MPDVKKTILVLCLFLTILSYFLLFPIYRPAQVDDVWTPSYVWNLTHMATYKDMVFGLDYSNNQYFGHTHAYITAFLADHFGWTHAVFHGFNLVCMLLAAPAWYLTGRRLLASKSLSALAVIFIYLTEAFIGCAYTSRSDALVFLYLSWGAFLASAGRFFLAALICSISVEVHAIGAIGYFYIGAFMASNFMQGETKNLKRIRVMLGPAALGILIGFVFYRFIHHEPLKVILDYLLKSNQFRYEGSFNALTAHYFHREYMRFIPELAFLLMGAGLFFRSSRSRESLKSPLVLLFLAALLASVVIRRGNFKYVVFFYPPLFFLAVAGYWRANLLKWAGAAFVVYCLTLVGLLTWQNRLIDRPAFDRDILLAVPKDERPIIGPSNAWFPLHERLFYENYEAWLKSKPKSGVIYFIDSPYTNRYSSLPPCAGPRLPVDGPPVTFNGAPVRVFSIDLGPCLEE